MIRFFMLLPAQQNRWELYLKSQSVFIISTQKISLSLHLTPVVKQ